MKCAAARVAFAAILLLCVPAPTQAASADGVPVLMYHRVDAVVPRDPVGRDLTVEPPAFEAQLRFLRARGVRAITAAELIASLRRGRVPKDAVVLTFDDGYADNATTALPLLRKYGARATFYISSGFIGTPGHVSWRQLRAMRAASMEVACHGTFHLDLSTLDRGGQRREAGGCLRSFARYLPGASPVTYAYPAGQYNAATLEVLRSLGMRAAFTERPGTVRDLRRPFELPRRRIRHSGDVRSFAALVTP